VAGVNLGVAALLEVCGANHTCLLVGYETYLQISYVGIVCRSISSKRLAETVAIVERYKC
jgi:hypothetical protein